MHTDSSASDSGRQHPAALPEELLRCECEETRTRRSGPGGQHRNKVETAIVVRHRPTGVMAEATERRSQAENRRMALFRLRMNLALAVRLPRCLPDASDGPACTALWQTRIRSGRLQVNPSHSDFPALLAEALDMLCAAEWEPAPAAAALGVSSSQLVKFLKREPRALAIVNEHRRQRQRHPLR